MFVMSLAIGIAITLSYDILRIFRRAFSHRSIMIAVEDIGFWLIWTYVTLTFIHKYGDGVLHWYMALGMILGILLFHYTISSALIKTTNYMLCHIKKWAKNHNKMLKNTDIKGKM